MCVSSGCYRYLLCVRKKGAQYPCLDAAARATAKTDPKNAKNVDRTTFAAATWRVRVCASTNSLKGTHMTRFNKDSKTHANLKKAFERECQTSIRYVSFANKADMYGYPDVAARFRTLADGAARQAQGHLGMLEQLGDPLSGEPLGDNNENLKASIAGVTYEHTQMYPKFCQDANHEGAQEVEEWFKSCARAKENHGLLLEQCLSDL